jgi:subtilisin family serine protease
MRSRHTKSILAFILTLMFSFIGMNNPTYQEITDFYYYKDTPFHLTKKTDGLFIKLKAPVSESRFREIIGNFSVVKAPASFDAKETKHFVQLNIQLNDAAITSLTEGIIKNNDVEYCSPVFSPDNGKTLIGVEDEIIVQFKPALSNIDVQKYVAENKFEVKQKLNLTGGITYILRSPKDKFTLDAANEVYRSGKVNWSEPNLYFTNLLCYTPNDTFYNMQWSIKNTGTNIPGGVTGTIDCDMDVDSAWDINLSSNKVKIAVIDTGVDTLHEDLAANMVVGSGYNFYNNTPGAYDDGNHGTACSGIIAAIGNNTIGVSGIAPNCKIIPVKWLSSSGNGNYTGAINSTIYAYQQGAWVLSNSWGFVGGSSSALDQAITDAATLGRGGKGSVFVVASGNENGAMRYPANTHPKVIAIGGISPCNQRKSPTSCDGEGWGASYGANLDLVSPCVKIYTTDRTGAVGYSSGNYVATFNGTSSATPNAAGVCALALSLDSSLTFDTLRSRLDYTAEKVGAYTYDQPGPRLLGLWNNEMGYGKINAYNLLKYSTQALGPVITHTPLANTENLAGPYAVNCVIAPSGSPINPAMTKIYWSRNNPTITDSVLMTNTSGNNWTANIPGNGTVATYRYYIKTADMLNRIVTSPANAPATLYSFLATSDITPPVITFTPLSNTPKQNWPAAISANVTDNIGVDSVWVRWYRNNTATGVKQFKLADSSANNYYGLFNSDTSQVAIGDSIFYRIIAQDISSNHNKDSTVLYSFKIISVSQYCPGNGTISVGFPFNTYWQDSKTQMLFLGSEIPPPWPGQTLIDKLVFNVISASPQPMNNLQVRIQQTDSTSLNGFVTTGTWQTVYFGTYTVADTGIQELVFQTPYNYPAAANLIVEICFDDTSYSEPSTIYSTTNPGKTWEQHGDNDTGCSFTAGATSPSRPNLCFHMVPWEGIQSNQNNIPNTFTLSQNYPNPFNPSTKIKYSVPRQSLVKLIVYDLLGREVAVLVNDMQQRGNYEAVFNASNFASGVYVYRIEAGDFVQSKKMVLIK